MPDSMNAMMRIQIYNRLIRLGFGPDRGPRSVAFILVLVLALPLFFFCGAALINAGSIFESSARFVLPFALRDTIVLSMGVACLTAIIGTGLASLVTYFDFPGIRIIRLAAILPLAFPTYLIAYILADIDRSVGAIARASLVPWMWDFVGLLLPDMRSMTGAILTFSLVLFPYVYLATRLAFVAQGGALIETARSLGRTPFEIYHRILLPLASPALATSVLLVIMETLNDIGASEYLGVRTLAFTIYTTWLNRSDFAAAIQLSLFLIIAVSILAFGVHHLARRLRDAQMKRNIGAITPFRTPRIASPLLFIVGALPIVFGFVLPSLYLLDQSLITSMRPGVWSGVAHAVFDSLRLSVMAALSVIIVSIILIYPHRLQPDRWTHNILRFASYGYAVPGVILGLAILVPFGAIDNAIDAFASDVLGFKAGLLLSGSAAILIFAYSVRFASVGITMMGAGYDKISRHLDLAARSLGQSRFSSFWRVPTRINHPAILSAALLVFVDTIKELPLTLILRPLGIDTLATRIYEDASIGQFEQASGKALILLLISTVAVVFVIGRQVRGDRQARP